jgi:UTP:GlnB (protein PII) uridylyltransferase
MTISETTTQFIQSMPPAYTSAFTSEDAEEHARIAADRGTEAARAVVWRTLPQGVAILCVVTDDRPGLVALVSAAFLAHALDVRAAQIYCRKHPDGRLEAVDFFWLRNLPAGLPLDTSRLESCARTIRELLAADTQKELDENPTAPADATVRVTYAPDPSTPDLWDVALEARDFPGLLHTVARLLHQHGLEVVRCEIRTEGGIARDRFFVTAFNGTPAAQQLPAFRSALLGVISALAKS